MYAILGLIGLLGFIMILIWRHLLRVVGDIEKLKGREQKLESAVFPVEEKERANE